LKEPRWALLYRTPYTEYVGSRLRRLREVRRMTQQQARLRAVRPNGKGYSQSTLCRLEAGYANAPLYAYIHFAEAYDTDPAAVLGRDEFDDRVTRVEMTMVKLIRRMGIPVEEAIARLVGQGGS
jgi:transcriptional regulator with XRE-family HTH domain